LKHSVYKVQVFGVRNLYVIVPISALWIGVGYAQRYHYNWMDFWW